MCGVRWIKAGAVLIGAAEERKQIYCKLYPAAILSPRSRPVRASFTLLKGKTNYFLSGLELIRSREKRMVYEYEYNDNDVFIKSSV